MKIYHDDIGEVELIEHMGSDKRVVEAARVCVGKEVGEELTEDDWKLIFYLKKMNHTSPFEHVMMTWRFVVPLCVAAQHMRHRTWAYNMLSRRYTSEGVQFFVPKTFRKQDKKNKQASYGSI